MDIAKKPYVKDGAKYIMMPGNAKRRHPIVEARTAALTEFAEDCPYNRIETGGTDIGIITSGTAYQYVKEIFGNTVSVFKLGLIHPLPVRSLLEFSKKSEKAVCDRRTGRCN